MSMPRCRPFTVIDGMILVAAFAFSFWLLKLSDEYNGTLFSWERYDGPHTLTDESDIPYLHYFTRVVREGAASLLLPMSIAFLIIRLRNPRPVLRRLGRQPGFAATSAVAMIVAVDLAGRAVAYFPAFMVHARYAIFGFVPGGVGPPKTYLSHALSYLAQGFRCFFEWYQISLWNIHPLLGSSVAAVWSVMAIGRTWRTEPGWIDRWGIAVGSLWVVVLSAYCFSYDWR